jgi:hypothetical protein
MFHEKKRSRDQRTGESFRIDDRYESLLAMPVERREAILKGSPGMRISYGFYVSGRDAALRLEKERMS